MRAIQAATLLLLAGVSATHLAHAQSNCGSGGGATVCLTATGTPDNIQLNWTVSGNVTGLQVYRDMDPDPNGRVRIAQLSSSARSYTDTSAVTGTPYWYWVKFTTAAGSYSSGSASATHGVSSWTNAKFGGGGYVTGLIFHPSTPNVLYARTDVGGAYRWNASTLSWESITDGFGAAESSFEGVESIALDPNNDQLVYLVGGMYVSADATARLYISSDRGNSWTHVNLPFATGGNNGGRAIGERLMVDPNKPSTLFYGSRTAGLWKSADSGRTWAQVTSLSSTKMTSDQISAAGGSPVGVEVVVYDTSTKGTGNATQTIYAAVGPDYAKVAGLSASLYKSTNGGASWTPVSTPVSGYYIPHMVRAADGMFYVAFSSGPGPAVSGPARLYKFDGSTWTLLASSDSGAGYGSVSVSGSGPTTRIALGVSNTWGNFAGQQVVQLSDDAGLTWHEIEAVPPNTPTTGWVDDIEIDPFNRDHILHVHGGGVVETRNASSSTPTWSGTVNGIEEVCPRAFATPPAGAPYTIINSAGDVGIWVHTDLTKAPTLGPDLGWSNGDAADMAWSDPLYIAAIGNYNSPSKGTGVWSGDGGKTWATFASLPASGVADVAGDSSIAVTARNRVVWAPSDSTPVYTTDNGATWTATNLPTLPSVANGIHRGYHLAADRKNPNKVYAYEAGGAWWASAGKVYVSTDGGHSFSLSQGSVSANLAPNYFWTTSLAVNPNAEGDVWLADGNAVYHSLDSGATWTKLTQFASITGSNPWPDVQGATAVTLGKAKAGASYSAAVYVSGVVNGVWGVYRSDDGGASWQRFNDDAHQFGGVSLMAADQGAYGRLFVSGSCRGVLYKY